MAKKTYANLGLTGEWLLGANGWKTENDKNLRGLDALTQASIKGFVSSLPSSPSDGDCYVLTAASGSIAANSFIRYTVANSDDGLSAAWEAWTPKAGWNVHNVADGNRYYYTGSAWSSSVSVAAVQTSGTTRIDSSGNAYFATLTVTGIPQHSIPYVSTAGGLLAASGQTDDGTTFLSTRYISQNGVGVWRGLPGHESEISAFFGGGVTPTTLNHAFAFSSRGTAAYINGTAACGLAINDSWIVKVTSVGLAVTGGIGLTGVAIYSTDAARTLALTSGIVIYTAAQTTTQTIPNGSYVGQGLIVKNTASSSTIMLSGNIQSPSSALPARSTNIIIWNGSFWY